MRGGPRCCMCGVMWRWWRRAGKGGRSYDMYVQSPPQPRPVPTPAAPPHLAALAAAAAAFCRVALSARWSAPGTRTA
jgi:hypothetical protein